jgi:phosphoribosylamine--glycine ligase
MKILVVGSGGREHALVKQIASSQRVTELYCAPGNAGIAADATLVDIKASDIPALIGFAKEKDIDLTVVGPEAPLCDGMVDEFTEAGLRAFGPNRVAAEIEGSKVFAKTLMQKHMIPTPTFRVFNDPEEALNFLRTVLDWPVVIKADGLAAGKGVIIAKDLIEADDTIRAVMEEGRFGDAGAKIVVEEFLTGEEASILALTDGSTIAVLESSQDHKAAHDGDEGPNTGGMGAYSPAPVVTDRILDQITRDILVPTIHAMNKEHRPYRGVLYAGLIITKGGPKVIEFNCRFGDPEAQVVLPRLKTDLVDLMEATIDGTLDQIELEWDPRPAMCVVLASGGYPGSYEKTKTIHGLGPLSNWDDVIVYHAGTAIMGNEIVTAGGRVLGITAFGDDLKAARDTAYEAVEEVFFENSYHRTDIGHRAL